MTLKSLLSLIRDELDAAQIRVRIELTPFGAEVTGELADVLMAKAELRRRGIILAP